MILYIYFVPSCLCFRFGGGLISRLVEKLRSSWTLVKLTTNMRNSKNIVEWTHKYKTRNQQGPVPICVSIPGPEPTIIVTATEDKMYTDGVLKAVEIIREKQETKFVILLSFNSTAKYENQVINILKESGLQCHRGPSGFNEEDSGCWIMDEDDFDGMESRSVIVLDTGYFYTNHMMRCTTNLIVVMRMGRLAKQYPQGYSDIWKVIEVQ